MRYTLAWSGGKDSTASLILAKLHGMPLDEIVTCMPDPFHLELEFKARVEAWSGMDIRVLEGPTFEDYFFITKQRGKYKGTIYGWPFTVFKTCARIMKWEPMDDYALEAKTAFIIGIAADEKERIDKLEYPNRSYLAEMDYSQKMARQLCEEYGLLNPLYQWFARLGCVRCPKQNKIALRRVRDLEPEKWQWCLDHDHLSPVTFAASGKTFRQIAKTIEMQDELLPIKELKNELSRPLPTQEGS